MTKCLSTLVQYQDVEFNILEIWTTFWHFIDNSVSFMISTFNSCVGVSIFFHKQYFIEAIRQNQQSLLIGRTIYKRIWIDDNDDEVVDMWLLI